MTRFMRRRPGFTLVELLAVIFLIILLLAMALLVVPNLSDKRSAARAADQLQGWLAQARSRAMRDQAPRGLRIIPVSDTSDPFYFDPYVPNPQATNAPSPPDQRGYHAARELEYVEQPPAFVPLDTETAYKGLPARLFIPSPQLPTVLPRWTGAQRKPIPPDYEPDPADPTTAYAPGDARRWVWLAGFLNANNEIQVGDYLEITHGTVSVHLIRRVESPLTSPLAASLTKNIQATPGSPATTPTRGTFLELTTSVTQAETGIDATTGQLVLPDKFPSAGQPANYRVIRRWRSLAGEPVLRLPTNTIIDLWKNAPPPPSPPAPPATVPPDEDNYYVRPLPTTTDANGRAVYIVMFGPSGALVDSTNSRPVLWVRHEKDHGEPTLIAIYSRTGTIAAHPIDDSAKFVGTGGPFQKRFLNPFRFVDDGVGSGL